MELIFFNFEFFVKNNLKKLQSDICFFFNNYKIIYIKKLKIVKKIFNMILIQLKLISKKFYFTFKNKFLKKKFQK